MKNLFRSFALWATALCLVPSESIAQWMQTNGPYGGIVISFAVSGTNLFVGTADGGVFLSTNNGTSCWHLRCWRLPYDQQRHELE